MSDNKFLFVKNLTVEVESEAKAIELTDKIELLCKEYALGHGLAYMFTWEVE